MGHLAWGKSIATASYLGSDATEDHVKVLLWKKDPVCTGYRSKQFETSRDLQNACMNGDLQAVHDLMGEGADVAAKGQSGNTSLHLAELHGHVDVLDYLLV